MKKTDKTNVATYFTNDELNIFRKYNMSDDDIKSLLLYFRLDTLAAVVWFQKYADKDGGEVTPDDMHMRLAQAFSSIEESNIIEEKKTIKAHKKEYIEALSSYYVERKHLEDADIFASMHEFAHIIPQGSIMAVLGTETLGSISNCIVIDSPYDSYSGIFKSDQELAQLMKMRCGVGMDITTLRPEGSTVNNFAKTSSGAVSFMDRFSNTTREVSQGSRRGALMISIDISHPDIEQFIHIKQDLTRVTGANISVKVSDTFMEAVLADKEYCLRWPKDINVREVRGENEELDKLYTATQRKGGNKKSIRMHRWVKARTIWDSLIKAAHTSAEPGILFWDAIKFADPAGVYSQYQAISTNPCGEIPLPANDSCRLIALNLFGFVTKPFKDGGFDLDKFYSVVYDAMRMSDNVVDLELLRIRDIIDKISLDDIPEDLKNIEKNVWEKLYTAGADGRRTGLGFTGLGDTLAAIGKRGLRYGSQEALDFIKEVMKTKLRAELDCTIDMAVLRGPFKGWDPDREFLEIDGKLHGMNSFYQMLCDEFPKQAARMFKYGRRNVSWSTVAPTGSLSMLAQVTAGIEPLFSAFYKRRKKLTVDAVDYDFVDDNGDKWTEHYVIHPKFKWWIENVFLNNGKFVARTDVNKWDEELLQKAFEASPWFMSTAEFLYAEERIETQAMVQRYTTHSISSTVNLPKTVSIQKVNDIYIDGWKAGLKGITVYRDGSRDGVLITTDAQKRDYQKFMYNNSIKRPPVVEGIAFTTISKGDRFSVFVGIMDGIPYELFAYKGGTKEGNGEIVKVGKGDYQFVGDDEDSRHRIITGKMTDEQEIITRLISGSLRHGRNIIYIVEDLLKTSGDMFGFNSAIARILKTFIPDGISKGTKCPQCGDDNVVYEEGCKKCNSCGWGAC